jgi:hypothetical protein
MEMRGPPGPAGVSNRPIVYRKLLRHLERTYDVREDPSRAKGSERMWFRLVAGVRKCVPVTCHGEGEELRRGMVGTIRRRLFPDGIEDSAFDP